MTGPNGGGSWGHRKVDRTDSRKCGTDLQLGASFDRESSAIRVERAVCDELGAHPSQSSAPDEVREARPQPRWGMAKRGTDGPARRSSSMSRGEMDGTTADSPPQTAAGRD
jgi:hypothetical protein